MVCEKQCTPLAAFEWLANADYWRTNNSQPIIPGVHIYSSGPTVLKKSTEISGGLTREQKLVVSAGPSLSTR